jgi:hypothetical protein
MQDWIVPVVAGVLALVALGLALTLVRARSRTDEALARSAAETAALRDQLAALERRLDRPRTDPEASFVITDLGREQAEPEAEPAPSIDSTLFADLVLRETVVKAASLAHGVRRALDPETRNRIRFHMKQEVRRSRKQRRTELREVRREWAARQREQARGDNAA